MMYFVKSKKCLLIGIGLVFLGGNGLLLFQVFYQVVVDDILKISPNGLLFNLWDDPMSMIFTVNYFNWTNPQQLLDRSVKPKFQEVGPYQFKESVAKTNIRWNNDSTVSFKMFRTYNFVPEESVGALSDEITTLQPLFTALAYITRNWNYVVKKGISIAMSKLSQDLYFRKTVAELTFDGFEDTLFNIAQHTSFLVGIKLPDIDRFGYFTGRNITSAFELDHAIATGYGDDDFGDIVSFKNSKNPGYFPGNCGNIQGSTGLFPSHNIKSKDSVNIFISEFCRHITLYYEKEVVVDGITGYKYIANEKTYDNGTLNPESKCFSPGECQPSGTANISTCILGFPIFISQPHFHQADPYYINSVEGMKPNGEEHSTYVIVEPTSGVAIKLVVGFQFNILLQPDDTINLFQDVPHVYFPIMWVKKELIPNPAIMNWLKLLVITPPLAYTALGVMFFVGMLLVTSVVTQTGLLHFKSIFRKTKNKKGICPELVPLTKPEYYGGRPRKFIRTNTCAF